MITRYDERRCSHHCAVRFSESLIILRLPGHQRDLYQLDFVRSERRGGPRDIAEKIRLIKTVRGWRLIVDDMIRNSAVDACHAAIAGIGQLKIFNPFCNGRLRIGTSHNLQSALPRGNSP